MPRQPHNTHQESQLFDELETFMRLSAQNDEMVPPSLREHLHVSTGLEDVVRQTAQSGRHIAITGTAGSGKSHLIRAIVDSDSSYECITDLTELPDKEWGRIFSTDRKVAVAGNEGAFLLGKKNKIKGFSEVVDALHAIQSGEDNCKDTELTVIDAAGFDVSGQRVVSSIVQLALITKFVESRRSEIESLSWKLFENEAVRDRLATLIEIASARSEADGFTFRQLWQFVADLILCSDEHEPWFARLFSGGSEISKRVNSVFAVEALALPHIGNRLWHADLHRLEPLFITEASPILRRLSSEMAREPDESKRLRIFSHMRKVALFALKDSPIDILLKQGTELWQQVTSGKERGLLVAINRYYAFGLIELGDDLELWIQHETARRMAKPNLQVSLGAAPATSFSLVKSRAVSNPPAGVEAPKGGRLLLRHENGATLNVTKDLIDGLVRVRSHRTHDRQDIEHDWRLANFFENVAASGASRSDRLQVAIYDFQARTGRILRWQVTDSIQKIGN